MYKYTHMYSFLYCLNIIEKWLCNILPRSKMLYLYKGLLQKATQVINCIQPSGQCTTMSFSPNTDCLSSFFKTQCLREGRWVVHPGHPTKSTQWPSLIKRGPDGTLCAHINRLPQGWRIVVGVDVGEGQKKERMVGESTAAGRESRLLFLWLSSGHNLMKILATMLAAWAQGATAFGTTTMTGPHGWGLGHSWHPGPVHVYGLPPPMTALGTSLGSNIL